MPIEPSPQSETKTTRVVIDAIDAAWAGFWFTLGAFLAAVICAIVTFIVAGALLASLVSQLTHP